MKLRSLTPATRRVVPAILALTAAFAPLSAWPQDGATSFTIPLNQPPKAPPAATAASGTAVKAQAAPASSTVTPGADQTKPAAAKAQPEKQSEKKLATAKASTKKPAAKDAPSAKASAKVVSKAASKAKTAAPKDTPKLIAPSVAKPGSPLHANMVQAFAAANKGDWTKTRAFAVATGNATFNALVQWRYLVESGSAAPFEELNSFLAAYPNWPRRDALNAAAERSMPLFDDPKQVIAWYDGRTPQTTTGKMRLGEALLATGARDQAVPFIRKAWIEGNFGPTDEYEILSAHSDILTANDQRARLDALLARDDIIAAKRQIPRVDADTQTLANARLQIKANPSAVKATLAKLTDLQRANPELQFDIARAYRRTGDDEAAWTALSQTTPGNKPLVLPEERWTERHIMTRDALKAGKYDLAYQLVSHHAQEAGGGFADAEFLAGWIALRFLHRPEVAAGHFQTLARGVSLPISKARAYYWLGRAEEELDRPVKAIADYREAALHRETFYGQLALTRIDDSPMLVLQPVPQTAMRMGQGAFDADQRILAIRLLADLNDRERMRLFAIRVANDPAEPARLQMLAELMVSLGDPAMGVRVAKLASYNGVVLASNLAPTMAIPHFAGKGTEPEAALVLGLTRQESEFDPRAVSSAGARGLMQLMPASAQKAAKATGLTYRLNDLTTKPEYNIQLGMSELSGSLDKWNGSYVLAIASYNAGPGNVARWVDTYGDPRDPKIDVIDWIELIPFGETRNYVQRVLENVEIYRNRLGGNGRLGILADLHRPNLPRVVALKDQPSAAPVSIERAAPPLIGPVSAP